MMIRSLISFLSMADTIKERKKNQKACVSYNLMRIFIKINCHLVITLG